ncbi:MAG TPA: adenylate kinase [Lachnoclostridium phytofermentans]|uniref:Adenylate kinase n=1 Tax=Lachnoclostridium phytofermentans TaxID=66219 RepID=A0A3D2X6J9_9FIRM|nr:adenylate kinase [Lachnoclostridium sp.]HCL02616.1 adenylate kinase [Lachnoclostridium phytofermentans]
MKKVMVIGCPGCGKSTFSKALHKATGLPLFHLDMFYWNADRTVVQKSIFKEKLQSTLAQETWIIDGNYGSTIELRLQACDTVFFLDYPVEVCLEGIQSRKGKARTDMPWFESVDEEDEEFITFINNYNSFSRPVIIDLLNAYADKNIVILKSRSEANKYVTQL